MAHLLVIQRERMAAGARLGVGHGLATVGTHERDSGVFIAGGVPPQLQLVVLAAPSLADRFLR